MESKTKNKQSRAAVERLAARAFAGQRLAAGEAAVTELTQGWFNAAYLIGLADGREVVLKIGPPAGADLMQYEHNIMATEVAALRLVRQNPAIPAPEIYFYDDSHELCDADYFFMARVEGENLASVRAGLPVALQAALDRQIGAIIREVNSFTGSYFGYAGNPALRASSWPEAFRIIIAAVLTDAATRKATLPYSDEAFWAVIDQHAAALDEVRTPCLVHWDGWYPNFFVREGQIVGIIDFERALWADPLMEAQFRQLGGSSSGVSQSMRGYGKESFTFAEEQRSQLYALHLALVMHTECYYRNYDASEVFVFSRNYIASTMAWLAAHGG